MTPAGEVNLAEIFIKQAVPTVVSTHRRRRWRACMNVLKSVRPWCCFTEGAGGKSNGALFLPVSSMKVTVDVLFLKL